MESHKSTTSWEVLIGRHYIFHIDPHLDDDRDLSEALDAADNRFPDLLNLLVPDAGGTKWRERFVKTNYWLHRPRVSDDTHVSEGLDTRSSARLAHGWVGNDGIHFGVQNMSWLDHVDSMTHEEIHAIWGQQVGEAPSLLNEGVAVWFEMQLSANKKRRRESADAWNNGPGTGDISLVDLCITGVFWNAFRTGTPVYGIAGTITGFLVHRYGLPRLRQLFLETHYEDPGLSDLLEEMVGVTLDRLASDVTVWLEEPR
jgi:hypothetical protein